MRMPTVRTRALLIALLSAASLRAQSSTAPSDTAMTKAQGNASTSWWWNYHPHGWSLTEENDSFSGLNSDSAYTQGIRLSWNVNGWRFGKEESKIFHIASGAFLIPEKRGQTPKSCDSQPDINIRPCGSMRFSFGQTMYTPPVLTDTFRNVKTRPYAGFLLAGFEASELFPHYLVTSELQAGLIGPHAYARNTQSFAHWVNAWDNTRPQGWGYQLRDRFQASFRNTYSGDPIRYCVHGCSGTPKEWRVFDVIPDGEILLGSPITRFSAGGTVRLGFGFPDLQLRDRIATTRAPMKGSSTSGCWLEDVANLIVQNGWIYAFYNVEKRYVSQNNLLTGTSADNTPDGWVQQRMINREPHVNEYARGVAFNVKRLVISYQRVTRSAEYVPGGGDHIFGSVTIALLTNGVSQ